MPALAPLQRRPAARLDGAVSQTMAVTPQGPLTQLAHALNGGPAVAQLHALSNGLSSAAPVQRVFDIRNGKTYDDGDDVRSNTSLANHLRTDPKRDEITEAAAKMADDVKDYGTLSWAQVIAEARKGVSSDDELMDFSYLLDDTKYMGDEKEIKRLNRSNSMDFSDLLNTEFGGTSDEAREGTLRQEFTSEVPGHTTQNYTTSGSGRLMSLASSQLGGTKYAQFIPKLKTKTGKSEQVTATLLLHALTNHDEYVKRANSEALPDMGRLALEQTVALFNNEIISRSSSNLPTIVGVLQSVSQGKTADMLDGFNKVGMFVPTGSDYSYNIGGQMLSRMHHKGSTGRKHYKAGKFEPTLKTLYQNYRGGLHKLSRRHKTDIPGLKTPIHKLHRRYIKNLKKATKIKIVKKK